MDENETNLGYHVAVKAWILLANFSDVINTNVSASYPEHNQICHDNEASIFLCPFIVSAEYITSASFVDNSLVINHLSVQSAGPDFLQDRIRPKKRLGNKNFRINESNAIITI